MDKLILAAIHILMWSFLIKRLFGGKQITYECAASSKGYEAIFFIGVGLLTYIKTGGGWGLFSLVSFILAGAIYHILPGGFSEDALIAKGKVFPFAKIDEMKIESNEGKMRINFRVNRLQRAFLCDPSKKDMIKAYIQLYERMPLKQ